MQMFRSLTSEESRSRRRAPLVTIAAKTVRRGAHLRDTGAFRTLSFLRGATRFHSLDGLAQPSTISLRAVGTRTESNRSPDARAEERIAEHENK